MPALEKAACWSSIASAVVAVLTVAVTVYLYHPQSRSRRTDRSLRNLPERLPDTLFAGSTSLAATPRKKTRCVAAYA